MTRAAFCLSALQGGMFDMLMMCLSLAVLVYLSMQMYRVYAYVYFSLGLQTFAEMHGN